MKTNINCNICGKEAAVADLAFSTAFDGNTQCDQCNHYYVYYNITDMEDLEHAKHYNLIDW